MASLVKIKLNNPRAIHLLLVGERKRISSGATERVKRYSRKIHKEIIRTMLRDRKTGNWYLTNGKWHRASAPGESPAKRTGKLIKSMSIIFSEGGMKGHIGASAKYAGYLENGTRGGGQNKRPAFEPTLEKYRKPFLESMKALVERGRR